MNEACSENAAEARDWSGGNAVRGIEGITVVQTPLNGFFQPVASRVSQLVTISFFGTQSFLRRIMLFCWDGFLY
jgi:hypothetical protein